MLTSSAWADELLVNGGFEAGNLSGWNATPNVFASTGYLGVTPTEGNWMAVMSPIGIFSSNLNQTVNLNNVISTTVSFDWRVQSVSGPFVGNGDEFSVNVSIAGQVVSYSPSHSIFGGASDTGWQSFSQTILTPGGVTQPFNISFSSTNNNLLQLSDAFIDNASVDATMPEPASLALLGAAAVSVIGVYRRRRRTS